MPTATPQAIPSALGDTLFNNDIQYIGKLNGFVFAAEYSFGESKGSTKNGASQAIALGYMDGPLAVGGAYTTQKPDVSIGSIGDYRDQTQVTFGGSYKLGDVRFSAG